MDTNGPVLNTVRNATVVTNQKADLFGLGRIGVILFALVTDVKFVEAPTH